MQSSAQYQHGRNLYSILKNIWILNNLKHWRNYHFKGLICAPINTKCLFIFNNNFQVTHLLIRLGTALFFSEFPVCVIIGHSQNECTLPPQRVCMNSSCILVLLVAYYINNIVFFILGIRTRSALPVSHNSLQCKYCSNTYVLLRAINLSQHLSNKSTHVAGYHFTYTFLYLYTNCSKINTKILHYSVTAGKPTVGTGDWIHVFRLNSFSHSWQRFSHSQIGDQAPQNCSSPHVLSPGFNSLGEKKKKKSLVRKTSHIQKDFYSLDRHSTNDYQPCRSC